MIYFEVITTLAENLEPLSYIFYSFSHTTNSALKKYILKNTEQQQVYATVTDKHSNIVNNAMPGIRQYYIEIKLDASKELHTIQISKNQYTSIVIIRLLIQN